MYIPTQGVHILTYKLSSQVTHAGASSNTQLATENALYILFSFLSLRISNLYKTE